MSDALSDYDQRARDARRAVAQAIRSGELVREPCGECGAPAEAHHDAGYEPEHWLVVIWLCRRHHAARHFDMTRQWSAIRAEKMHRWGLRELRLARGMTQAEVAGALGIAQSNIAAVEGRTDIALSTLRAYVEALGGRLELAAVFPEDRYPIAIG
jgi:DNA-binding XRE family transcriptional regulator